MNRLERISAILVGLQSRSVITARQLADQFGVSLRTIYRDIRVLEESGVPIIGESGSGYSLVDGYKLPPLMFSTEEAIAFLMAEKHVSCQADGDTYRLYRSGMDKIRAVLKAAEKNILEDFDDYIMVVRGHMPSKAEPSHILQPLLHCIINRMQAGIEYFANYSREVTNRVVEPLGIYFIINNWYVLAWCRLRKDYRTFNLSLIQKLIPMDEDFGKQHPSLKDVLSTLYAEDVMYDVKVRVEKSALRSMGMTKYIFGLYKEEEEDGYVIQYYVTHSLEDFARWYLSFADRATILEPSEFKDTVVNLLRKIRL